MDPALASHARRLRGREGSRCGRSEGCSREVQRLAWRVGNRHARDTSDEYHLPQVIQGAKSFYLFIFEYQLSSEKSESLTSLCVKQAAENRFVRSNFGDGWLWDVQRPVDPVRTRDGPPGRYRPR